MKWQGISSALVLPAFTYGILKVAFCVLNFAPYRCIQELKVAIWGIPSANEYLWMLAGGLSSTWGSFQFSVSTPVPQERNFKQRKQDGKKPALCP